MKDRRVGIIEMLICRDGERRKTKGKKVNVKDFGGKWRRKKSYRKIAK